MNDPDSLVPPNDPDAERAVLGSCILDGTKADEVAPIVGPADFHDQRLGIIFRHVLALRNGNSNVDVTLLFNSLKNSGELEAAGGSPFLQEVVEAVPFAAHAVYYAKIVQNHALRRRVRNDALKVARLAYSDEVSGTELLQRAQTLLAETAREHAPTFERLTCAELDGEAFQVEYLIDRTLIKGQPCIVAGSKKSLKTSLIVDMGIALAKGGFFLGKLKVGRACRVGIMSGESGMPTIQETARRICRAAGYELADIEGLVFSEQLPRFENPEHVHALRTFIERDRLEVLAIDPAYLCMAGNDAGNLFVQGETLRLVNEVCTDTNCTMVLAHHTRKGGKADPFSPPELEDIAWSGFQEWARQWILVGRREKYEPGSGFHALWLNIGGSAGHSALWGLEVFEGVPSEDSPRVWEVAVVAAEDARQDAQRRQEDAKEADSKRLAERRVQDDKGKLLRVVLKFINGETPTVLRDSCGLHDRRFKPALAALLADGDIVPCEITKANRKQPYDGYKPAPPR